MQIFDKKKALDEIVKKMQSKSNPTISECVDIYVSVQNYLIEIHECGFKQGFEKGIEATTKVNEL